MKLPDIQKLEGLVTKNYVFFYLANGSGITAYRVNKIGINEGTLCAIFVGGGYCSLNDCELKDFIIAKVIE